MGWREDLTKGIGALADRYTDDDDTISWTNVGKDALMASAAYAALNPNDSETLSNFMGTNQQGPVGYMGGIPNYTASRELLPDAFAPTYTDPTTQEVTPRRPGSAGRRYFTDTTFVQSTEEPTMGRTAEDIARESQQNIDNQAIYESLMGDAFDARIANEAAAFDARIANEAAAGDRSGYNNIGGAATPTIPADSSPPQRRIGPQHGGAYTFTDGGGLAVADPESLTAWTYIASEDIFISRINGAQIDNTPEAILAARELAEQTTAAADTDLDAIAEIIRGRGGSQTPAQAASAAGISEEELIVQLIRAGETTYAEVAEYYQAQYPGITAAQVEANYRNTEFAQGGNVNGYYLGGPTDGMADQIPATIDNSQPAALSDGEFVIPADIVSHLGNGNSEAGAESLYSMMERVRTDRTGNPNQGRQIDPNKYLA